MAKYKVEINREECIGCGACAAVAAEHWEMDDEGKSVIKGTTENEKEIEEKDLDANKEAAEACPVNVIHITNLENDEKII